MEQLEITTVLNRHVFETEKAYMIRNIAENPERFLGVFRSTTPRLKLVQNVLQSREIRFGDALEVIVRNMLASANYVNLERSVTVETKKLNFDQYFTTPDHSRYYLVEQKIRDDHDSTKKTGQIDNFKKKLIYLKSAHGQLLEGSMYFIDPSLTKNKGYYLDQCQMLSESLGIPVKLYYNGEFFQSLFGDTTLWSMLASTLLEWRGTVPTDVAIDCDDPRDWEQIRSVEPHFWHKLAYKDELWEKDGVLARIFPSGESLREMSLYLAEDNRAKIRVGRGKGTYLELAAKIRDRAIELRNLDYELPGATRTLF